jgi:hypothetical protein
MVAVWIGVCLRSDIENGLGTDRRCGIRENRDRMRLSKSNVGEVTKTSMPNQWSGCFIFTNPCLYKTSLYRKSSSFIADSQAGKKVKMTDNLRCSKTHNEI